jgi:hypothetical protein
MKNQTDMKKPICHLPFAICHLPFRAPFSPLPHVKAVPVPTLRRSISVVGCSMFLFALTGCTSLTYTAPTGERFTRSSLGANTSLQCLSFEATTNGLRRVELRGYQTDQNQALGTVTEAAIRAALQSAR